MKIPERIFFPSLDSGEIIFRNSVLRRETGFVIQAKPSTTEAHGKFPVCPGGKKRWLSIFLALWASVGLPVCLSTDPGCVPGGSGLCIPGREPHREDRPVCHMAARGGSGHGESGQWRVLGENQCR